jgi:molecular chaperone DnaK
MGYSLGVDLGTAYTAAAVCQDGQVEVVRLGDRSDYVPSVVYRGSDGNFLFGELAERHSVSEPERISREFKRRMGDTRRIIIGGTPMPAHALSRAFLIWVLELVESAQGEPPEHLTVSFPANWGPYKRELLHEVTALPRDVPVTFCTEPEAVAIHFASSGRFTGDGPLAVYDLGAGTFDTCLLGRTQDGLFELLGTPEGIEQCGGEDFDYAILQWALSTSGVDADEDDEDERSALAGLRRECVEAKEALSSETEVTITGSASGRPIKVRLTRPEFEELIRPRVAETVDRLEYAIRKAGQRPADLSGVVLAGGSARVPLVTEMVTERLARSATVSTRPKLCVAMGAALIGATNLPPAAVPRPTALEVRRPLASSPLARMKSDFTPALVEEPGSAQRGAGHVSLVGATAVAPVQSPVAHPTALLRGLSWYRYATLALGLLAIILALVGPGPEEVPVIRWNSSFVGSAPQLPDGAKIQPTLLGLKPLGLNPARVTEGKFDLKPYRFWLGGPVAAEVQAGADPEPRELRPQEFTRWRFVNVGFVAATLCVLFSFAYVTSMLRRLRRLRRSAGPTELLGLAWAGGFVGIAVVLGAWVLAGNRLDGAVAVMIIMTTAVAVAMLGLGKTWRGTR